MEYLTIVRELLLKVQKESGEAMRTASEWVADAIVNDRIIWVFGSGHAGILADETFYRAGGLACVSPIHIPGLLTSDTPITITTEHEREDGYALAFMPYVPIHQGDIVIVHSVSGRNAAPVEVAEYANERDAHTIGITSLEYAKSSTARNALDRLLHEVVDLVIDDCAPIGDAAVRIEGMTQLCSPVSTVLGAAILHTIFSEACRLLVALGIEPPVFRSANLEGGDEYNKSLLDRYRGRVTYLSP